VLFTLVCGCARHVPVHSPQWFCEKQAQACDYQLPCALSQKPFLVRVQAAADR
jgi:hypothetical protein